MLAIAIFLIFQTCASFNCINGEVIEDRIKVVPQLQREMAGTGALHKSATDLGSSTHFCGAALISDRHLLTAAHCMTAIGNNRLITISLGRNDLNVNPFPSSDTYGIKSVIIHHAYDKLGTQRYHDIAIIETKDKVQFSSNIWPFCLPGRNQDFPDFHPVRIAGWGLVNEDDKKSTIETPYVNLVANSRCESLWQPHDSIIQDSYPKGLTNPILCTQRLGVQSCQGDSGGPVTALDNKGRQILIGIISRGINCPRLPTLPTFNTKVSNHIDWIYEKTGIPRTSAATKCGKAPTNAPVITDSTPTPNPAVGKKWRSDGRCGAKTNPDGEYHEFKAPNGKVAECNPNSAYPCCSGYGWCGIGTDSKGYNYCTCINCEDYRDVSGSTSHPTSRPAIPPSTNTGCPAGFFMSIGSKQCFKLFRDVNRSWDEAKTKCEAAGLKQANPSDDVAIALRKDLHETYGGGNGVWLDARGDDSKIMWKSDGTELKKDNPLWFPWEPHTNAKTMCVVMLLWDKDLSNHPEQPYAVHLCSQPYLTLCEVKI